MNRESPEWKTESPCCRLLRSQSAKFRQDCVVVIVNDEGFAPADCRLDFPHYSGVGEVAARSRLLVLLLQENLKRILVCPVQEVGAVSIPTFYFPKNLTDLGESTVCSKVSIRYIYFSKC
jgi:hypothetical protein